jgi:hypothetical protein
MISKEVVRLASVVNAVGTGAADSIEERIELQKKVYLLALCGINLGYIYSWDMYGPFSRTLAAHIRQLAAHKEEVDRIAEKLRLSAKAVAGIKAAEDLMKNPEGSDAPRDIWLEMLTTVHFLAQHSYATDAGFRSRLEKNDPAALQELEDNITQNKPHLRPYEALVGAALERVRPHVRQRELEAA